jgi:hypothetical protein
VNLKAIHFIRLEIECIDTDLCYGTAKQVLWQDMRKLAGLSPNEGHIPEENAIDASTNSLICIDHLTRRCMQEHCDIIISIHTAQKFVGLPQ